MDIVKFKKEPFMLNADESDYSLGDSDTEEGEDNLSECSSPGINPIKTPVAHLSRTENLIF